MSEKTIRCPCGKEFRGGSTRTYCCNDCRRATALVEGEKHCRGCGVGFLGVYRRRFCDTCKCERVRLKRRRQTIRQAKLRKIILSDRVIACRRCKKKLRGCLGHRKFCDSCRVERRREREHVYRGKKERKAALKRWRESDAGRDWQYRYRESGKAAEVSCRYRRSEKGRSKTAESACRWRKTNKGIVAEKTRRYCARKRLMQLLALQEQLTHGAAS